MSGSRRYVLDANVFIEAKNKYYDFDFCPGFWAALIAEHRKGRVSSIDKVFDELADRGDPLSEWVKHTAPDAFFKKTQDQAVVDAFQGMVTWANSEPQFMPAAKADFASTADGWLIALAKANGLFVVTHEEYAPDVKRKIPIPNVCVEFEVEYVNTFEMLADLGVKLVLSPRRQRRK
jgi:hypothetical protein